MLHDNKIANCQQLWSNSNTDVILRNRRDTYYNISMLQMEKFCDKADRISRMALLAENSP